MAVKEFRPIPAADKAAALEAIMNYKKQNPVKFELKKESLFKKYGLELEDVEEVKDETDVKLEKLKKKLAK